MPELEVRDTVDMFLRLNNLHGENFDGTPERVERMWKEFFSIEEPTFTNFPSSHTGVVLLKGHEAWGFCPHHLLPVRYVFKIAYIPSDGRVCGISKLARIADWSLRTLPLQEDLPIILCDKITEYLRPLGVAVLVEGEHLCMRMRGVESPESVLVTKKLVGLFTDDPYRREFLHE